jgi:hypothetical protein
MKDMFSAMYSLERQRVTPRSEANILIEANRPDPNASGGGAPFSRGGGRFFTQRMMSNLKIQESERRYSR